MAALGLPPDASSKVAGLLAAEQLRRESSAETELAKLRTGWQQALKVDPVVGGADFDANRQTAVKAMVKFGDDELKQTLEATGLGDHPAVVRAFFKVGKALAEDTVAGTASNGAAATTARPGEVDWRALYNKSPELNP